MSLHLISCEPCSDVVLVPREPTRAMLKAATDAMRKFREQNPDEPWVSSTQKAAIRWRAMLTVGERA